MRPRCKQRLVLVGNGMAGMRVIDEILARDRERFEIEVIGAEPRPNYNRILLSAVLAGEKEIDDIVVHSREWYARNDIRLAAGETVVTLDASAKTVTTAAGRTVGYDRLVLATGSRPLVPPVAGLDLPGVCAFRNIADLELMRDASRNRGRAVVVGGGLLGLEAAFGLMKRGMAVTVLHLMQTMMERQLDEAAGLLLQRDLEASGVTVLTKAHSEAILGDTRVEAVQLADGRELPADLVVFAVGVRPNIDLARAGKLDVNRGIIVDDFMATSEADIFAVGECVEHRGQTFGLVGPLWKQARICAAVLCGERTEPYVAPPPHTSLKVTGVDVFSAGVLAARDDADEEITLRDAGSGQYKKLVVHDGRLVGAILYGEIADGPWFVELIESKRDITPLRDGLIFGRAVAMAA
ncbi:MAG TPA: FAD-dependent oxidoreductase [Xanthobacteraceae bacterium]|nr:FAD-dependent oxidoreductase [Xanthobacteraceae bacterium]